MENGVALGGNGKFLKRACLFFLSIIFLLSVFAASAFALDQLLALHGRATSSGTSISSGDVRVSIYDANVGGNLIYDSASDFNGTIVSGVFDIMVGSGSVDLDLNYGTYYYMDININGTDMDFNGSERKQFEATRGSVPWTSVSKTGADLNSLRWGSDFNSQYARKSADENVTGSWNFAGQTTYSGGFASNGVTITNGIVYTQSLVLVKDFNAVTVNSVDMNGNFTPSLNNTWDFGSATKLWKKIWTQDLNVVGDLNGALSWFALKDYPAGCGGGQFISAIGDSVTCSTPAGGGDVTWSQLATIVPWADANVADTLTINTNNNAIFRGDLNSVTALSTNVLRSLDDNALNIQTRNTTRINISTDGNIGLGTSSQSDIFQLAVPGKNQNMILVNSANQRIGIAKTAPSATLDINGTLLASGDVGFGTTTPTSALQLIGDSNFDGNTSFGGVEFNFPVTDGSANQVLHTDGLGNLSWNTDDTSAGGSDTNTFTTGIQNVDNNNFNIDLNTTGLRVGTSFNGDTQFQVGIPGKNRNMVYLDGTNQRIGIGNASPSVELDVNGQVNGNTIAISNSGSIGQLSAGSGSTSSSGIAGSDNTAFRANIGTSSLNLGANNSATSLLINPSAWTEASSGTHPLIASAAFIPLNITNGNGTTTNISTLYIMGSSTFAQSTNNPYALWIDNNITTNLGFNRARFDANLMIFNDANIPAGILDINANNTRLVFTTTGLLGIGTTTPTSTLQVVGDSNVQNIYPDTNNTWNIGTATNKYANIYGVNINAGDIILDNGVRITEDGANDFCIYSSLNTKLGCIGSAGTTFKPAVNDYNTASGGLVQYGVKAGTSCETVCSNHGLACNQSVTLIGGAGLCSLTAVDYTCWCE